MISRVHGRGKSFKKLCSYLATGEDGLQLERERVLRVECFNLPTRNWEVAACMMAATASTSVSNAQEPVYHFSVSCHPDDPVDAETLRRIARRTIRDMGLRDHQVVVFAHKERSHLHLHFVVNRVHPERGTLWSMWRDCYRMERSLRAQERELGLLIVPGWLAPTPAVEGLGVGVEGPGQEGAARWLRPRPGPRRGDDDFLRQVTERATPVLERAQSWAELERGLADHGLSARVHRGGLQFTDGRFQVKASAVGRAYSRKNLEKRFGGYPDYRARMAVASQTIVPPTRALQSAAPAQQQEPPAPPHVAPAPEVSALVAKLAQPSPPERVDGRRRPQFGDAGHGIAELFGRSQALPEREPAVASVECASASEPSPEHSGAGFLKEVQERAGLVLRRAESWAVLERGLSEQGLSLRVSGGGFRVTDGIQEVKASDVGRAFSRFHLEKRLGPYPAPVPIIEPEALAPPPAEAAELPQAPVTQPQQLALPLPAPAVQEGQPSPRTPRFTLYEQYEAFGVYDSVGPQIYFTETRERAVTEVERANRIAAAYPVAISIAHLRQMDGAWRDARGLPRLPELAGRRLTLPAPEELNDDLSSSPPAAYVQPKAPTAASAAPEPVLPSQPEPAQRTRQPVGAMPVVQQSPQPVAPEVRRPAAPRRTRSQPPTDRDNYREVVWYFKRELAALYRDPRAARRAFDVELGRNGTESAVHDLTEAAERYGKLRILVTPEHIAAAVPWAALYGDWQRGSTRPVRFAAAELLEAAALPYRIIDARAAVHAAEHELAMLPDRQRKAAAAETAYEDSLQKVYRDPTAANRAIDEHWRRDGTDATAAAIEDLPGRFGALRPNAEQGWLSRQWNGLDTSVARGRAASLAHEFRTAQAAISKRPEPEDYLRAAEAAVDAKYFVEALEERLARLPHKISTVYAKEALRLIDEAARASGRTGDQVTRQVRSLLSEQVIPFVVTALKAVGEQERAHERGLNNGPGYSL